MPQSPTHVCDAVLWRYVLHTMVLGSYGSCIEIREFVFLYLWVAPHPQIRNSLWIFLDLCQLCSWCKSKEV